MSASNDRRQERKDRKDGKCTGLFGKNGKEVSDTDCRGGRKYIFDVGGTGLSGKADRQCPV